MAAPSLFGAGTNFAALSAHQKMIWSLELWKEARNLSFVTKFLGTGSNSMIQRVTELKASEKGNRAVITLLNNGEFGGVAGDSILRGNETLMTTSEIVIHIDQLRDAKANQGRMADQKSVVDFRTQAKDLLAYGMADIIDQFAFLTLSGITYNTKTNGAARAAARAAQYMALEFASDVTAPSANRHRRWDAATKALLPGDTTALTADDTLSYGALVELKAYARENGVRGVMDGGSEIFNVFVTPTAMAQLRLDPEFLANARAAAASTGDKSALFMGATDVFVDGMVIRDHRHVFNTRGLASGSKWGATGTVDGCRVLFCGAQALAYADIGNAFWNEETDDYGNRYSIGVGKIFGLRKPQFMSSFTNTVEDYGVIALDVAQ